MSTMNISMPHHLKAYVDAQVRCGGYGTSSEYIRELIRDDQQKKAERRLTALLLEGLESGPAVPADAAYWEEKRRLLTQATKP